MDYDIVFKRVYEPHAESDGDRVLVDRLWPRGKRREELHLHDWYRDASPSTGLRRDWHRGDIDDAQFAAKYREEMKAHPERLAPLMTLARAGRLTLLTASRDPARSHLSPLRQAILEQLETEDAQADGREPSSPPCYAS